MMHKKIFNFLTERKINKFKKSDPEIYNITTTISDVMFGEDTKGFMITATKLIVDEEGKDMLSHKVMIGKGFKIGDIIPSIDEHKKLAHNIVDKIDEK